MEQQKKKKPIFKKWWFWVICIVLLLGVIGSLGDDETANNDSGKQVAATSNTDKEQSKEDVAKEFYSIGEIAKVKDVEMTVVKVEKSNGSDFDKPKDGMEFVIVTVKIKNSSKEKIDYNPFYFKMQNSKGQIQDEAFSIINQDTALQSGELAAGGEVEGSMVFEEPKNDTELILQYQNNIFSDDVKLQFSIK